jgi:hypothetical protein
MLLSTHDLAVLTPVKFHFKEVSQKIQTLNIHNSQFFNLFNQV